MIINKKTSSKIKPEVFNDYDSIVISPRLDYAKLRQQISFSCQGYALRVDSTVLPLRERSWINARKRLNTIQKRISNLTAMMGLVLGIHAVVADRHFTNAWPMLCVFMIGRGISYFSTHEKQQIQQIENQRILYAFAEKFSQEYSNTHLSWQKKAR